MVLPVFRFHSHYHNWEYHPMPCSKYFLRLELKEGCMAVLSCHWTRFSWGLGVLYLILWVIWHALRVFLRTWLALRGKVLEFASCVGCGCVFLVLTKWDVPWGRVMGVLPKSHWWCWRTCRCGCVTGGAGVVDDVLLDSREVGGGALGAQKNKNK